MSLRSKNKTVTETVGERLCNHKQDTTMTSESFAALDVTGVEDAEEFDEAVGVTRYYCKPVSLEEYENQAETETEKAINGLMNYLDTHREEFTEHLKKKKRQELESGGVVSFVKVKVMDMIHGSNSPLLRVSEKERDKRLEDLKFNMIKAFDISQETKGRRVSKRLQEKRNKKSKAKTSTQVTAKNVKAGAAGSTKSALPGVPPPPPPPPPILPLEGQATPKLRAEARKPLTPIENRITEFKTPYTSMKKSDLNDTLGATPAVDVSLTSLHQELLSSNPWKRLKCVDENRSPGGTPNAARSKTPGTPIEPLHIALVNKFRNVRSPSPVTTANTTLASPSEFTP